ncbi:MAG: PIF1 family DEAD/DEAH box helicase, partial [Candidatus Paceibacterota bacterium]
MSLIIIMTQDTALSILKTGANVFLTGEPGSGKTHVINCYVAYLRKCGIKPAITASTGIAATHIGGMTIHSWSGIGIRKELSPSDIKQIASDKRISKRIGKTQTLIVDEISMLDGKTLILVDQICKAVRYSTAPFGGMQIVLVGDFFQLPPVASRSRDDSFVEVLFKDELPQFAFKSPAWIAADFSVCYLSEQHRQAEAIFLELLSAIRSNTVSAEHRKFLDRRLTDLNSTNIKNITKLFPHNENVDRINSAELENLPGESKVFFMEKRGDNTLVQHLKRGCLSPERLELKPKAVVMFTKNNFEIGFVNGTLGVITDFDKDSGFPIVKARNGKIIAAEPLEWSMGESGETTAAIKQVPLRLAWAITVHKSQGMSLDAAFMDLSEAFVEGQGYVALSRV